jgi:hypothetical protein
VSQLAGLYSRYKGLALAVGAGLILDDGADLTAETLRLAADAGRVRETYEARVHGEADAPADPNGHSAAAQACHRAALDLHRLAAAAPGSPGHSALIEQVRASHKALRALLWDDIADQYAPCGAHPHGHAPQEHPHGHAPQEHAHGHAPQEHAHSHAPQEHAHPQQEHHHV